MRGYYGNLKNHQSTPSKVKIELFNYARIAILVHRYSNVEKCRRKLKLIVVLFPSEIQQYYTGELRILLQYIHIFRVNTLFLIVFGTLGVVFLLLSCWRTFFKNFPNETYISNFCTCMIFVHLNPKTSFRKSMYQILTSCAFSKGILFQIAGQLAIQVLNKYLKNCSSFSC